MADLVVAMTGASGALYAVRLLQVLLQANRRVHLVISPAAVEVLSAELGLKLNLQQFEREHLLLDEADPEVGPLAKHGFSSLRRGTINSSSIFSDSTIRNGQLIYHNYRDYRAGIASGSFLTGGMVICPCSMGTLASIATGQSQNLIHRAADVHLKEHRKLIVVPRETPLSSIALGNMHTLSQAGVVVLPAMPGFYHGPTCLADLVDFVVARICDQLGVTHELARRWGGNTSVSALADTD